MKKTYEKPQARKAGVNLQAVTAGGGISGKAPL
jgi:hypothetical protein